MAKGKIIFMYFHVFTNKNLCTIMSAEIFVSFYIFVIFDILVSPGFQ